MVGSRFVGYIPVNVKIRAMKSKLLSLPDYDRIIQAENLIDGVNTIIRLVKPSKLAEELELIMPYGEELGLAEIDRALTRSFIAVQNQLGKMIPEDARNVLEFYYLKKYKYNALKTIIKAIHQGILQETIQEFIMPPIPTETEELLELIALESVAQLKDALRDKFAKKAIIEAFEAFEETDSTLPLELSLDRELYKQLWKMISNLPKNDREWAYRIFGLRVDWFNILAIIRGVQLGLDPPKLNQFLIPVTYRLEKNLERAMASQTTLEALQVLSESAYKSIINSVRVIIEEKRSLADVEHIVEEYFIREDVRVFYGYPFHFGMVLGFLNLLSVDLRNMKAILVGKVEGVSADKIRESLVFF